MTIANIYSLDFSDWGLGEKELEILPEVLIWNESNVFKVLSYALNWDGFWESMIEAIPFIACWSKAGSVRPSSLLLGVLY